MRTRVLLGLAPLALAATPALAEEKAPPKLVVAVSVDQFSADLFAEYRRHFTGGLARLQEGAVFPSAFQSHAATETCPGHSTLLTGVRPARNGIIANNWYDLSLSRAEKRVYCAEDERDPASSSSKPVVSAVHLKVPTLGEYMKRQWPGSRNVAVSAKDRAVVMMGGHRIDAGYWFTNGVWDTFKGLDLPPLVAADSKAMGAAIAKGAKAYAVPKWCQPLLRTVKVGDRQLGAGTFPMAAKDTTAFRVSPRLDAAMLNLAGKLVDDLQLGRKGEPDLLSVSLSATDYIGHDVGNQGAEMCVQMYQLDQALGAFFAKLDKAKLDYVVMLTADHGGLDVPERLDEQALPRAARVDPALAPAAMGKALAAELKIAADGPLVIGDGPGEYYVSNKLTPEQRGRVIDGLIAKLRGHPQIAAAFGKGELLATPMPTGNPQDWNLRDRVRASFDPARSGDVVGLLDRAIVPIAVPGKGYAATHGSVWDYDRRVPLLFWRKGLAPFEQSAPVETVDIAPSLAAMLKLKVPDGAFDGRCLDLDAGAGNTCGGDQ